MAARHRFTEHSDETEPLYAEMQEPETKTWDAFLDPPREPTVGSEVKRTYIEFSVKFLKVFTMILAFVVVLGTATISKGTALFMTSQIRQNVTRSYCNKDLNRNLQFLVTLPDVERVQWIWLLIFSYFVPEFGTWFRACRKCLFKHWTMPSFFEFFSIGLTEICSATGTAILVFVILPEMDVVKGAMLTNAMCFVPGVIAMFSRNPCDDDIIKMTLDIVSIVAQASCFVIWPLVEDKPILFLIPVSVLLISVGWWENFVSESSQLPFIRSLGKAKKEFHNRTYFVYVFVAPLKCLAFLLTVCVIYQLRENDMSFLFNSFSDSFQDRIINGTEIAPILISDISDATETGNRPEISVSYMTAIWVWLINIITTYICYAFGKFSCKIMIQVVGFAFPINLSVPVLLSGLIAMCGMFYKDECSFADTIPAYLFFELPPLLFLDDFLSQQHAWIWLIWLLSQAWITIHIWTPNCDKLSSTEQLFIRPMYDAFLIDQSLAMNRRREEHPRHYDGEDEAKFEDMEEEEEIGNKDAITRIYACGTMWHETDEEMMEFLKSIIRLDQDQCAHRIVRETLHIKHSNYYELETHIFFDDAFVRVSKEDNDPHVNEYVESLASLIDEAASKVHKTTVKVRPPKVFPTPYGGRLVWTLPGKTKMIAHLKDKAKIRAKKRWSQCMYMYYLLGYRLQANEELTQESKNIRAENTYILALDGDIDFQPEALHLLVDYMKKNKSLGAACGRIHPIGSGGMVWYQMFEYAVGHWMQKATEHVIGCVLCSPGCFSLFRGKGLMDKSVMRKYTTRSTQAKHYVQYDQGEDRWLCTLLLQRGYRVEYSAASDAFTHCPEGFNEFYNQRRRWMPSTMANIMDLLMDAEHTVNINENISWLYIGYQIILMVGTVIGPGTIFLMLEGAFVVAFGLDQWSSFLWNLVPIILFIVVCATCNSDIQLFFAGLISAVYGLIMMAVFVGVMLQISEDGFLAPSSLFFFCMVASFIIAAILHPMEFNCLKYGIVYYVTVPSMYMLLVIYSVFNMNNVSWGTREVTVVPKDPKAAPEPEPKKEEKKDKILTFLGANSEDDEGAWEFSVNKLFKCMLCTYKGEKKENEQLKQIQESLTQMEKKIESIGKQPSQAFRSPLNSTGTTHLEGAQGISSRNLLDDISEESIAEEISLPSDDIMENSWFYDGPLIRGEIEYLPKKEESFWKELIEKYLHPIEDDKKKVSADLKDLRDKMVFTFLMLNSLFVLVMFLLTLKKDLLHLNWPIDPKVNFTYHQDKNEVDVYITYLELEPIGFVFLIFFALLMLIQFVAMIIHRFGTFSQVMTKTQLDFNIFNKSVENMSEDELKQRDPLKIVADLQKLKGINNEFEDEVEVPVEMRKTVNNLAQVTGRPSSQPIFFLDEAFHRRVTEIGNSDKGRVSDLRKKSVAFVQRKMSRAAGRRSTAVIPNNFGDNSSYNTETLSLDEQSSTGDAEA